MKTVDKERRVAIPTLAESAVRASRIPNSIRVIREKENLSRSHLARTLGVHRNSVLEWEKGIYTPREPIIIFTLVSWADRLIAEVSAS